LRKSKRLGHKTNSLNTTHVVYHQNLPFSLVLTMCTYVFYFTGLVCIRWYNMWRDLQFSKWQTP